MLLHINFLRVSVLGPTSGNFCFHGSTVPAGPRPPPHYWGFKTTLRHTHTYTNTRHDSSRWVNGRSQKPLYLTTHSTHRTETSMLPAGFEHTIPAWERPQTHALDRAATGDKLKELNIINLVNLLTIFVKILIALPFWESYVVTKLHSKYTEHFSRIVGINGYTEVVARQSMRSFACIPAWVAWDD
jgi:hypothetical protein